MEVHIMKRIAMLFIVVMTLLLSVSLVIAQPMGKGHRGDRGPGPGFINLPDLTPEQMAQMKKLHLEHQKEMLPIRTKIKSAELDMQQLLMDKADQKMIYKKIEEIGMLKIEVAKLRYTQHLAVRTILTDEQKAKFDAMPIGMGLHGRDGWDMDDDDDEPACPMGPRHDRQ
jgi:Spy/CpxP family protein refolding chaperone